MFTEFKNKTPPVIKAEFQLPSFLGQLISIIKRGHYCCMSIVVTKYYRNAGHLRFNGFWTQSATFSRQLVTIGDLKLLIKHLSDWMSMIIWQYCSLTRNVVYGDEIKLDLYWKMLLNLRRTRAVIAVIQGTIWLGSW